jgi:hypothetical protein
MELHATIAWWQGDQLMLWDKSQWGVTVYRAPGRRA